jgi:hypothetical protein
MDDVLLALCFGFLSLFFLSWILWMFGLLVDCWAVSCSFAASVSLMMVILDGGFCWLLCG